METTSDYIEFTGIAMELIAVITGVPPEVSSSPSVSIGMSPAKKIDWNAFDEPVSKWCAKKKCKNT